MSAVSSGFDLYARYTDVNGKTTLRQHRVWDKLLFVQARTQEAMQENMKQLRDDPMQARFEQLTEEQYRAARRT